MKITLAHLKALEAISMEEDTSLRSQGQGQGQERGGEESGGSGGGKGKGAVKHWYLVFEDDATVEALERSTLYAGVTNLLGQLPSSAQVLNLGACKGRLRIGGQLRECYTFGMDPFTFAAKVSLPGMHGGELECCFVFFFSGSKLFLFHTTFLQ